MSLSEDFLNYVQDQLAHWEKVSARRMFGGAGLDREGKMFGLIAADVAYLKVDDSNRNSFVKTGSSPFNPHPGQAKKVVLAYYEIPPYVLADRDEHANWARRPAHTRREQ